MSFMSMVQMGLMIRGQMIGLEVLVTYLLSEH